MRPRRGLQRAPPASARSPSRCRCRAAPPKSSPSRAPAAANRSASPYETTRDRALSSYQKFDAAVLRLAVVGVVGGDGLSAAIADRSEAVGGQAGLDQIVDHRLRTLLGEGLVEAPLAVRIGVAGDLDVGGGAAQRRLDQMVENAGGIGINVGALGLETDLALDQELREQLLADGAVNRSRRRFHCDLGLVLPAFWKVLAQVCADVVRSTFIQRIA